AAVLVAAAKRGVVIVTGSVVSQYGLFRSAPRGARDGSPRVAGTEPPALDSPFRGDGRSAAGRAFRHPCGAVSAPFVRSRAWRLRDRFGRHATSDDGSG